MGRQAKGLSCSVLLSERPPGKAKTRCPDREQRGEESVRGNAQAGRRAKTSVADARMRRAHLWPIFRIAKGAWGLPSGCNPPSSPTEMLQGALSVPQSGGLTSGRLATGRITTRRKVPFRAITYAQSPACPPLGRPSQPEASPNRRKVAPTRLHVRREPNARYARSFGRRPSEPEATGKRYPEAGAPCALPRSPERLTGSVTPVAWHP
jgi:hypothetical protein